MPRCGSIVEGTILGVRPFFAQPGSSGCDSGYLPRPICRIPRAGCWFFALDTFAAETLVDGLQAFACLVTRLWQTLPSTGCLVGRSARFLRKLVVLEGVRSRLCLALALDASREIRVALQALGLPHRRATSTVSPYSVPFVTVAWGAALPWDTGIVDMICSQKLSIISKSRYYR